MASHRSRRRSAGIWAMLPLGLLLLAPQVLPPPDVVPVHRGAGGRVDAVSNGAALLGTTTVVAVIATVAAALVVLLTRSVPPAWSRVLLAVAGAVGAGAAGGYLMTVLGTRVGADPAAGAVGWPLAALPVAFAWGWVGYAVHGRHRPDLAALLRSVPERDRVVRGVADHDWAGQVPLPWVCDTTSPSLRLVAVLTAGIVVAATGLLAATGSGLLPTVPIALAGAALVGFILACVEVQVVVDPAGLRVRSRTAPLTLLRVPAADVVGVGVADLDPLAWGGSGLHWLPDRTGYIGSGGPGIVVHRRSGRRLAIELTEGEGAARGGAEALRQVAAHAPTDTSSP